MRSEGFVGCRIEGYRVDGVEGCKRKIEGGVENEPVREGVEKGSPRAGRFERNVGEVG